MSAEPTEHLPAARSARRTRRRRVRRALRAAVFVLTLLYVLYCVGWLWAYLETMQGYYVPKTVIEDYSLPQTTLNGHKLHLVEYGDSTQPAIIVLHDGPGADSRELQALAHLRDSFRVVLFDNWGTGLSERAPVGVDTVLESGTCPYTLAALLLDVDSLVARYTTPQHRPILLGKGFGCVLAVAYAQGHPSAVGGLLLLAPRGLHPPDTTTQALRTRGMERRKRLFWAYFERKHIRYVGDLHAPADHQQSRRWALWDSSAYCPGCNPTRYPLLWRAGAAHAQCLQAELFDRQGGRYRTNWDSVLATLRPVPSVRLWDNCRPATTAGGLANSCFPLLDQPTATLQAIRQALATVQQR